MNVTTKIFPSTPNPSPDAPFYPTNPVDGFLGFYPAHPNHGFNGIPRLPLPLVCASVRDDVAGIEVEMMFSTEGQFGTVFTSHHVTLSASEVFRHLFFATGVSIKVLRVVWKNGGTSFANWWQDATTGAFCIQAGRASHFGPQSNDRSVVAIQGGYRNHMPARIEWTDEAYGKPWNNWSQETHKFLNNPDENGVIWHTVNIGR